MLALALLLQTASPIHSASVYRGSARELDVAIPRIEASVRVDGVLDEPAWSRAALLTGFSQYRPADGRPAQDSTVVLVWYAPDAIYFGIRAFEAHGTVVRATLANRDNLDAEDRVQLLLDTYADRRRALLFAVNPLGVQQDGVWSDGLEASAGGPQAGGRFDATIDLNPDYVYDSRGHLTSFGYEVEVRIPFKSLRYQSVDPQTWGLQVDRVTQHTGHEDTWTPAVRANASFLVQSGRLVGLTQLRRGLVMDVTPEFTTKVDGTPRATDYLYTGESDVGGTLRWGVTENLSLTASANPDFSQVEADVGQVTANARFPLFFPEKRPFFLEGLEQYDSPSRLIYTRRVAQPLAGAKLTGKVGGTNVAYLAAVDDRGQSIAGDQPFYNLLRVRRDLGASSAAGLVYTDRSDGSAYNRVAGADLRVVWRTIWFSQAQLVGSWTRDPVARAGTLWDVTLYDRTGRAYGNHFEIQGVSPDFVAGSGFVPRTDYVQLSFFNRFSWYGRPGARVEQVSTFIGFTPLWRYDDFLHLRGTIEGGFNNFWTANLRGGWGVNASVNQQQQRFDRAAYAGYATDSAGTPFITPHGLYNLLSANAGGTTPNRAITAGVNFGYGATPIFAEAAEGRALDAQVSITWRPAQSVRVEALWTHQRITRARDGSRFATANIPRFKLEYQPSRAIFFRYVGQYFSQRRDALVDPRTGLPLVLDSTAQQRAGPPGASVFNSFRNDVLFSYRPTPGTVLFLGYGASLTETAAFRFSGLERTGDGFFLKASYLFRI